MSQRDVQGFYEGPPDNLDMIYDDLAKKVCNWDLKEVPCEECHDNQEGGDCYFFSDGGYEPRDGTYLCKACARKRYQ